MIFNKEPISQNRKLRFWIGMLVIFCLVGFVVNGWAGIIYVLPISLIVLIIFIGISEFIDKPFDGWRIEGDSISLTRISLFGRHEKQTLRFKSIDSILYIRSAARRPFSFKFISKNQAYYLMPSIDIYGFSETLQHLKKQGIKIDFLEKDHEVELFLDNKIDSIPMTNDMKIRN